MAEYAVHYNMKIVAHRHFFFCLVACKQMPRVIIQFLSVSEERGFPHNMRPQHRQCHIQKPQVNKECVSGKAQNILCKLYSLIHFFKLFVHILHLSY